MTTVGRDTLVVTTIHLDTTLRRAILSDQEHRRAERFVFARDRRRFVAAHTAMRILLGEYLRIDPALLRFASGSHGKPYLTHAPLDLRFNLSHSGERALLAVALGLEVGVDIEQHRRVDNAVAIAERAFSSAERMQLACAKAADREETFFRMWTRKESFVKALGKGMSFPLASVDVTNDAPLLSACSITSDEMQRWAIGGVAIEKGYAAAVTVEGGPCDIRSFVHSG